MLIENTVLLLSLFKLHRNYFEYNIFLKICGYNKAKNNFNFIALYHYIKNTAIWLTIGLY